MTAMTRVSRLIPADRDQVWETLTSREGMRAYMLGADVNTDWEVGSPITMKGEFGGKPYEDWGEIRSFEPGRRFSYTHHSASAPAAEHLVTFELQPKDGAVEVTITQENADGEVTASDREHKAQYEKTWSLMLEALDDAVRR